MSDDSDRDAFATRREWIRRSAALVGGGLFAGCTESSDAERPNTTSTATASPTSNQEPYAVEMAPVGRVEFDAVPERWVANNGSWADMGVALGLEPPAGVWLPGRYHTRYYDDVPGVSVDGESIRELWGEGGVGKEQFYALDADVHVADPNFLLHRGQWKQADVEEIATQVGPFFGNSIFSRGYDWHEGYRYYTLYEAFEKLAAAFRRRSRFEAFDRLHDDFRTELASVVPERGDRPSAAVLWAGGDRPEEFYPYVVDAGTSFKHLRDLNVADALAASDVKNFHSNRGVIDFETLLEVDPEVLLLRGQEAKTRSEFRETVVAFLDAHDVASALTAVQNGDVYRAGPLYQGPITNLVVTERLARTLYGVDEKLFDRQRVADVVHGNH